MHQGRTFLVKEVNHDRKIALVEQATLEFQTRQRDFTYVPSVLPTVKMLTFGNRNVDALDTLAIRQVKGSDISAFYGTVNIESVVFGYFKTDRRVRSRLLLLTPD
jgi:DEAD/DEAH box helicase domain-containing protein